MRSLHPFEYTPSDKCRHEPETLKDLKETRDSKLEPKDKDKLVKIAILDTGIDLKNEDFQSQMIGPHKNFCGSDVNDVQDLDGHGTQIASIISRLADRAQICVARILDGDIHRGVAGVKAQVGAAETHIRWPQAKIVVEVCIPCQESMSVQN